MILLLYILKLAKKPGNDRSSVNGRSKSKVGPKTLVCSGVIREESVLKESDDSTVLIITTVSRGKPSLVSSANEELGCTVHTAGSTLQMKANLVSLCN